MTYTKPNLFELGSAKSLVLGTGGFYIEDELTQATSQDARINCELPEGGEGVLTVVGCQPA